MSRIAPFVLALPLVLGLSACDVSVRDETPAQYAADYREAMYPIKAAVARDSFVAPDDVYLTAVIDRQSYPLEADRTGAEWHALFPTRCHDSFQLQYRAAWSVAGLMSESRLFPDKPRTVRLTEPPLTADAKIDTSAKSRKGWRGTVQYQFVTEPTTQITAMRIEPLATDPASVRQAADISVATAAPVLADCGKPVDIELESKAQRASAYLVIDTSNPSVPHWRTRVDFAP